MAPALTPENLPPPTPTFHHLPDRGYYLLSAHSTDITFDLCDLPAFQGLRFDQQRVAV